MHSSDSTRLSFALRILIFTTRKPAATIRNSEAIWRNSRIDREASICIRPPLRQISAVTTALPLHFPMR